MKHYKTRKLTAIVILILALGFTEVLMYAQAGRGIGRLKGIVIDEEGNHVANATIEIVWHVDKKIKHETRTNKKGRFVFMNLGSGNWQIFANAEGFRQTEAMAAVQQLTNNPVIKVVMRRPTKSVEVMMEEKLKKSSGLVDKANALYGEAKFDEARELYEEFLEKQPEYYQTHIFIGNCYKEQGEFDKAMVEYQKLLDKTADADTERDRKLRAQTNAALGDVYVRKNDMETAQEYFKKSLELYPKDEILAYNVGEIFFSNNKTEEAIHYFKLAASIKPDWGEPHLKLGYTYLNTADYKNAVASFKKFLELAPQSKQAAEITELIKSLEEM